MSLSHSDVTSKFLYPFYPLGCGDYHLSFSGCLEIGMVRKAKKSEESDLDGVSIMIYHNYVKFWPADFNFLPFHIRPGLKGNISSTPQTRGKTRFHPSTLPLKHTTPLRKSLFIIMALVGLEAVEWAGVRRPRDSEKR